MAGVKALDKITEKWARVSGGAQAEYTAGVEDPRRDWASSTKAAEDAYKKGVAQASAAGRFGKGVAKAGTEKWKRMALQKGPHRWSEGIGLAKNDYATAFAPYHTALGAINYPPKGPKGDPQNIQRVAIVAKTLHELKLRIKGGA
jgi:hypothetical protein